MNLFVIEIVIELCFVVFVYGDEVIVCSELVLCCYVELVLLMVDVLLVEVGIGCYVFDVIVVGCGLGVFIGV